MRIKEVFKKYREIDDAALQHFNSLLFQHGKLTGEIASITNELCKKEKMIEELIDQRNALSVIINKLKNELIQKGIIKKDEIDGIFC